MHHGGELLPGIFPRLYGQAWLARHLLLLSVLIAGRCRMLAPSPVCRVILYIHVRSAKTHFGLPHWSACGPRNCHRQLAFPTEECHMSSIPTFRRLPLGPLAAALCLAAALQPAAAQETKITLGMSGWTGFAPLTLADKAGIFKKNGLAVDLKMIPQKDRHLALASGAIQCAATTIETHVAWNTNGVPIVQIFQMDKSYGADGIAVRNDVKGFADLKGKTVAVSAPGTAPYFGLAWMLHKNGMTMKDVKTVSLEPQPAAQAFVAGQNDAAMSYEPYLSTIRANPAAGKILATTIDYPMVMDTVGCDPKRSEERRVRK